MTTDCSLNYKFNTWKFLAQNMGRTCCVQKLFWMSETISVHNKFSPGFSLKILCIKLVIQWTFCILLSYCGLVDAKIRASDKDLPVLDYSVSKMIDIYFALFTWSWDDFILCHTNFFLVLVIFVTFWQIDHTISSLWWHFLTRQFLSTWNIFVSITFKRSIDWSFTKLFYLYSNIFYDHYKNFNVNKTNVPKLKTTKV